MRFRSMGGWAVAIIFSFMLNAVLFGIMPELIRKGSGTLNAMEDIQQINVIRVKKLETAARKKEPEKIKKPDPVRQSAANLKKISRPRPADFKPRLKFQLNPRLPAGSMDLAMPPLEHFSLEALKSHYTIGDLDSPLTALVKIPPVYPVRAKRRSIQGYATVEFIVTTQGLVEEVKIIKAEPEKIFDHSVFNCVSRWKFNPGTVEGIPVSTLARTTIRFELEN